MLRYPLPDFIYLSTFDISVAPPEKEEAMQKVEKEASSAFSSRRKKALDQEHHKLAQSIRWLWYEFTPYEVGCDELGGKIESESTSARLSETLSR